MRKLALLLALPLLLAIILRPSGTHIPLDPDEPIAADGSLIAGRAQTIFDTEPLLGAFGEKRPDLDDPKELAARAELERHWTNGARDTIGPWLYRRADWRLCEQDAHVDFILAARRYYDTRGRQKASFAIAGPNGRAFIENEWSTPIDRDIDAMVRHLTATGFLDIRYMPAERYPEFAKVVARVKIIGVECASLKLKQPA
jgi:hypothetical protein